LIGGLGVSFLKSFLIRHIDYDDKLAGEVAALLAEALPEHEKETAETLAQKYTEGDDEAVEKVTKILDGIVNLADVIEFANDTVANEVMQGYQRCDPRAVKTVHELFTNEGEDMDSFMADALVKHLDDIERIERLITSAESRRNNALREIDRRRAALGEALRRSVQQIEDGQFKEIATTSDQGKNAA
jgi:hypothetical protein